MIGPNALMTRERSHCHNLALAALFTPVIAPWLVIRPGLELATYFAPSRTARTACVSAPTVNGFWRTGPFWRSSAAPSTSSK